MDNAAQINQIKRTQTEFTVLPAFNGDCILIKTFDLQMNEVVILIDGGPAQTFSYSLKKELLGIDHINIIILTHIDSDHIGGLIKFFKSTLIEKIAIDEIWINHPEMIEVNRDEIISTRQGDTLKQLIYDVFKGIKLKEISTENKKISTLGTEFFILSPTPEIVSSLYEKWKLPKERALPNEKVNIASKQDNYLDSLYDLSLLPFSPDKSISEDIFNSSSISFLLRCQDLSILLLADSRAEVVEKEIRGYGFNEQNPLFANYVKISHHGSLNNTSQKLLGIIESNNFIISTNGGTANHKHPSRETISRIIYASKRSEKQLNIYFNYNPEDLKNRIGDFITDKDLENGNWRFEHKNKFQ